MDEYIIIGIDGERYLAHRVAWLFMTGNWPTDEIDHVDLVKSNNAFSNLREATRSENQRNTRVYSNNKMRLKGVSANFRGNSFRAQISINGRTKRLGSFPTPEQAHAVYLAAAKDLAGDFARPE